MTTVCDRPRTTASDGWWDDLDGAVLECLATCGRTSPEEIGRRIELSPEATTSLLAMLASQGRVRICAVEAVDRREREWVAA
jgi:hypothetical protein